MQNIVSFLASITLATQLTAQAGIQAGETIGIDFDNSKHGNGTPPAKGANFNHFDDGKGIADGETVELDKPLITTKRRTVSGLTFSFSNHTGQATNRVPSHVGGMPGTGLFSGFNIYSDKIISNETAENPIDKEGFFLLTFSGLDDTLSYTLAGGYHDKNDNYSATWSADGQSFETPTKSAYGSISNLRTDGQGNLHIKVTKRIKHVTIAGLTLTASVAPISSDQHAALIHIGSSSLFLNRAQ